MFEKHFVLLFSLVTLQNTFANAALYLCEGSNFNRLIGKFPVAAYCSVIPTVVAQNVYSLRTDECIIFFESATCAVSAVTSSNVHGSLKIAPGDYFNKSEIPGFGDLTRGYFQSYRKCNNTYGGPITRVTLYDRYNKILVDYDVVCQLTEIPAFANYPYKIENYGNCIKAEIGNNRNSSTRTEIFYGGAQKKSLLYNLWYGTPASKLVSISPCNAMASCVSLNATITGFEVSADQGGKLLDVSIGDNQLFINKGMATVSQNYRALLNTSLVANVILPERVSEIRRWDMQTGISNLFSSNIPTNAYNTVVASLSTAFKTQNGEPWSQSNVQNIWTEYQVDEKIQIEACTRYQITSFVRIAHQFPMTYKVTYEVTGVGAEQRPLLVSEIQPRLGTSYVSNKTDWTAVAADTGTIYVDFGLETVVHGKAEKIVGCMASAESGTP